jgi:AsmA protein
MKTLRRLTIALAVFAVILAAGIAWLVASFDAARLKQEAAAAVERQTGRILTIEGEPALAFWPRLGIALGRTSLAERDGRELARIERARIAVAVLPLLQRRIAVEQVQLDGFALTLVKRKDGTLNIAGLFPGPPVPAEKVGAGDTAPTLPAIDIAGIRVTNARLDWRDETTGSRLSLADLDLTSGPVQFAAGRAEIAALTLDARGKLAAEDFTLKLEVPHLAVAAERIHGDSLTLSAKLAGQDRQVAVRLALAGLDGNADTLKADKLGLDVDAQLDASHLVAKLTSPLALDLTQRSAALTQLGGQLSLAHPRLRQETLNLPLTGIARADFAKQTAQLRLGTELDASHLKATLDVERFAPLALGFDLDIDRLDLDRYLPEKKAGMAGAGTTANAGAAADDKLDFAALADLNLHGTARIGQLRAAGIEAGDIRLRLAARDGRLNLAPLTATLYDGRLAGALTLDATHRRVAVQQTLTGVRIGPLLQAALGTDLLDGRGDAGLDVAGSGATVGELRQSLAGSARIALADGAIKGYDIGRRLRELQSLPAQGKDAAVAADATQGTDFSELSASFRIASGVARNDDLKAKSPLLRLTGAGDIDLGRDRLDYLLKASLVATATGQGGKELDRLKGVTLPLRLTGPFAKPDWKLELAGMIEAAARARLAEKHEALRKQAEEKLKGKLKGLLGK